VGFWARTLLRLYARVVLGRTLHAFVLVALATSSCKARTVGDAERDGDVGWLDANGSQEAVAALGRLADANPKAVEAINSRVGRDVAAYVAAWNATVRGAAWGSATLHAGLADPARAEDAASVMGRKDAHLVPFLADLEAALVRLAAGHNNSAIGSVLASVGPAGDLAVMRRLEDPTTRGAMCRGISSPDSSADARRVLMRVSPTSRDDAYCVEAVLKLAIENDTALEWLASTAEPGLLSAAGSHNEFPCARLKPLWATALATRPQATRTTLTVPLLSSVSRCAATLDPVLSEGLLHDPAAYDLIVGGIDPYGTETQDLKATCATLRSSAGTRGTSITRGRAIEAIRRGCQFAK
jgi:hypothetical protein